MKAPEVFVPEAIGAVLEKFEASREPFTEADVATALSGRFEPAALDQGERLGCFAEWSAFSFLTRRAIPSGRRETYFAPRDSFRRGDGIEVQVPCLRDVSTPVVDHWRSRANQARNPILRARYADLVWDLERLATGRKRDPRFARQAIDAYLEAVQATREMNSLPEDPLLLSDAVRRLERALTLALAIRDADRMARARDAMLELFEVVAEPTKMGTWTFVFDRLLDDRRVTLSSVQHTRLIKFLEGALALVSDIERPTTFDPWVAATIAARLGKYHAAAGKQVDEERVVRVAGRALEAFAAKADPLVSMTWLDGLRETYQRHGLPDDAKRVQLASKEKGKSAAESMPSIAVSVRVTPECLAALAAFLTEGSVELALERLAHTFTPSVVMLRGLLDRSQSDAPLGARIPVRTIADGHVAAVSGSIEDDPEGRLSLLLARWVVFSEPLLGAAFEAIQERYSLTAEHLVGSITSSPLADPKRTRLLGEGFEAYFRGDHVKAIHVLIPQLEHLLRRALDALGEVTDKAHRTRPGMQEKNWNDILAAERIQDRMPEDLRIYLVALFADARGPNLRNRVCHGLVDPEECNRPITERVIHALLAVSCWSRSAIAHGKSE